MKNFIGGHLILNYILYKKNEQRKYKEIKEINDKNQDILNGIKLVSKYKVSQYKY